jgi:hypothetical protein
MSSPSESLVDDAGSPTPAGWRAIGKALAAPMPTRSFPGRGGRAYEYLTATQVARRLDEVVGPGNWSDAYVVLGLDPPIVACALTLFGVSKSDVGQARASDDEDAEEEPMKAAYTDALKRAALKWGIGRWLRKDPP